jgi:hypothetical protein
MRALPCYCELKLPKTDFDGISDSALEKLLLVTIDPVCFCDRLKFRRRRDDANGLVQAPAAEN